MGSNIFGKELFNGNLRRNSKTRKDLTKLSTFREIVLSNPPPSPLPIKNIITTFLYIKKCAEPFETSLVHVITPG